MKNIAILLSLLLLFSCKNATTKIDLTTDSPNVIKKWYILGTFPSNKPGFLHENNLKSFGYSEASVTYRQFCGINKGQLKNGYTLADSFLSCFYEIKNNSVDDVNKILNRTDSSAIKGNFYLGCNIKAKDDGDCYLEYSSDDGSCVWINNKKILEFDKLGDARNYEKFLKITLKKGDNFLLVKVNNKKARWQVFASIEKNDKENLNKFFRANNWFFMSNIMEHSIYDTLKSVKLNISLPDLTYNLKITGPGGKLIQQDANINVKEWSKNIKDMTEGLYTLCLTSLGDSMYQTFYNGDLLKRLNLNITAVKKHKLTPLAKINFDALLFRLNHIMKPENRGKNEQEKRLWERKALMIYSDLLSYKENLDNRRDPIKHIPGTHIRSYISEIDNMVNYYMLYIPKNYDKNKPLPLAADLAVILLNRLTYLESWRVAYIKYIDYFQQLADKYNFAIVAVNSRLMEKPNRNNIEISEFFEALNSIKNDYNIDTSRIYLMGTCSSGNTAAKMAAFYPDKFAAIAMASPSVKEMPYLSEYEKRMEPVANYKNLLNIPVFLAHGPYNTHISVEGSDILYDLCVKKNKHSNFIYIRPENSFGAWDFTETYMPYEFEFFKRHKVNNSPREIYLTSYQLKTAKAYWLRINSISEGKEAEIHALVNNNTVIIESANVLSFSINPANLPIDKSKILTVIENKKVIYKGLPKAELNFGKEENVCKSAYRKNSQIEGPLAHALISKFILAVGTNAATSKENKILKAVADSFEMSWKRMYFNGCNCKLDKDITETDIKTSNLILLGNQNSNSIIKRIYSSLPVKIESGKISINDKTVIGNELGFYLVYPNPLNPKKYIGIIGYNNPSNIALGPDEHDKIIIDNISEYGWYDFKVWDAENDDVKLKGYFGNCWQ